MESSLLDEEISAERTIGVLGCAISCIIEDLRASQRPGGGDPVPGYLQAAKARFDMWVAKNDG